MPPRNRPVTLRSIATPEHVMGRLRIDYPDRDYALCVHGQMLPESRRGRWRLRACCIACHADRMAARRAHQREYRRERKADNAAYMRSYRRRQKPAPSTDLWVAA